jgi:hypothetical protein
VQKLKIAVFFVDGKVLAEGSKVIHRLKAELKKEKPSNAS